MNKTHELRRILTGPQGHDWLTNPTLRRASVSFLLDQQRLSPLDTPEVNVRYDVFVSFDRADKKEVLEIVDEISKAGIKTFVGEDQVKPGNDFRKQINYALSSSGILLFCIGANTKSSNWQQMELAVMQAGARSEADIIPILLPGSALDDIPPILRSVVFLDLRDGISQEKLGQLTSALRHRHARS